ncbi:YTH domain-containing family protein 2-like [Hordeum vulgare]|nr:YTH domain-containing family protein 2-like [Hordeum vulgare]
MKVHVEYPKHRYMLLGRGWKAFNLAHSLEDGHVFRIKLTEYNMLSFKFYGRSGVRLSCWEDSSSALNVSPRAITMRRTAAVRPEQGLQVLKIFKDDVCKTSMLDDFGFYDNREKIMQEKKSKRQQQPLEKMMSKKPLSINNTENQDVDEKQGIMNKKLLSTRNTENQDANAKQGLQELKVLGEKNPVVENGVAVGAVNGVAPTNASPTAAVVGC